MEDARNPGQLGAGFRTLMSPRPKVETTALAQLEGLGFSASDVRHIAITHLDLDHSGGLPDFPDADVHVLAPELEAALHPKLDERCATSAAPTGRTAPPGSGTRRAAARSGSASKASGSSPGSTSRCC